MVRTYLEAESIYHNYEEYSPERVRAELEKKRKNPDEPSEFERLYDKYADQFSVLYRIHSRAAVDEDEGEHLDMTFKEIPYTRPEIESEKGDIVLPETQLELECTFEDGTRFGFSALEAMPTTADSKEPRQMRGQIHIAEDTLKTLNDEKFKRIVEFCDRYGFSSFSLNVPMYGGEIDVDGKLAELFERYQKARLAELEARASKEEDGKDGADMGDALENEEEHSEESFPKDDFYLLSADVPELEADEKSGATPKKQMSLTEMVNTMRLFLENDLQKREGLSYFEHIKTIDGRRTYVYSIYDKESPDNYRNDGRKGKDGTYATTASCRLMVSQDETGKFCFGYCTPNGSKMKDTLASDFLGEIKKTGVTHLNFSKVPNDDKMVWLIACAEKGLIPTGLSLAKSKVKTMLSKAEEKLSTEEYATFVERLMDQWEENAAKKGTPLPTSDQEFIRACRNLATDKRVEQYDLLEKAEFDRKFKNFRDSYGAADGLLTQVNKLILKGSMDRQTGAATTIAAMNTLARTFDIVLGLEDNKKDALDVVVADRLDVLMKNPMDDPKGRPTVVRITEEEKRALTPIWGKQVKELVKEDYKMIFDVLYKRQFVETRRAIIDRLKEDKWDNVHAKDHILLGEVWNRPLGQVQLLNKSLSHIGSGVKELTLPDKHSGLSANELKSIAAKEYEEEKAKAEAAKAMAVKTPVERSR